MCPNIRNPFMDPGLLQHTQKFPPKTKNKEHTFARLITSYPVIRKTWRIMEYSSLFQMIQVWGLIGLPRACFTFEGCSRESWKLGDPSEPGTLASCTPAVVDFKGNTWPYLSNRDHLWFLWNSYDHLTLMFLIIIDASWWLSMIVDDSWCYWSKMYLATHWIAGIIFHQAIRQAFCFCVIHQFIIWVQHFLKSYFYFHLSSSEGFIGVLFGKDFHLQFERETTIWETHTFPHSKTIMP